MTSVMAACAACDDSALPAPSLPQLDAAAVVALRRLRSSGIGARATKMIDADVMPRWQHLDRTAKELIVVHALNTDQGVRDALSAGDALLADASEARRRFYERLAELCEAHANCQLTDEDFLSAVHEFYSATTDPSE